MHLGHCIDADARFRLFVFAAAGDAGGQGGAVEALCSWLQSDLASPIRNYNAAGDDVDGVIDVRAVFQQGFRDLDHSAMPPLLRPYIGRLGLCDYEKVFCADHKRGEDIFEMRGVDRTRGCIVIVRPDQYVGHVLPIEDRDGVAAYFAPLFGQRKR